MNMVYISLALLFISALLLTAEMFIPGFGVSGISGCLVLIASVVITVMYVPYGLFIVIAEIASFALLGLALFNYIKRKQLHGKLILNDTYRSDEPELGSLDYFMGKEGISRTPLKPVGMVDFNGVGIEVYSDGSYIPEKRKVKVVDVSQRKIIVKQCDTN